MDDVLSELVHAMWSKSLCVLCTIVGGVMTALKSGHEKRE
jgi:hypothetical protein